MEPSRNHSLLGQQLISKRPADAPHGDIVAQIGSTAEPSSALVITMALVIK